MKYRVYLTGHRFSTGGEPPCIGAVKEKDKDNCPIWTIEISSLEDLHNFILQYGAIILGYDGYNKMFEIEIYNDYRE